MSKISAGTTTTTSLVYTADTSGVLQLQTNGTTTAVTIDTAQNVGIGTSSPAATFGSNVLQLYGSASTEMRFTSGNSGATSSDGLSVGIDSSSIAYFYNRENTAIVFGTNNTERARIDNSGRLLINTTSGTTNSLFQVSSNGTKQSFQVFNNDNVQLYSLGTGLVYSNAGVLTSTNPSDSRLKDNITDISWGLTQVNQLRPVSYDWKIDNIKQGTQYGFIAQEVQSIMPDLVKSFKAEDGNEYLGLEKEGIYATLVKAIQELSAQVTALQAKVGI